MEKNKTTGRKPSQSAYALRFRRRPITGYGKDAKGRSVEVRSPQPLMGAQDQEAGARGDA